MTLSEGDFNQQCIKFVERCRDHADEEWSLSTRLPDGAPLNRSEQNPGGTSADETKLMLMRNERRRCCKSGGILNYEYTVIYSESYEVPVMYFCISDQNGAPVELQKETLTMDVEDVSMIVNQVEHPLLFRPFYMVHPCRTRDFMEPHLETSANLYLISWLSVVANLVGLRLDNKLGCAQTSCPK